MGSFTQKLNLLKSLYFLPRQARTDLYFRVILPSVTYGVLIWWSCDQVLFSNLESTHVRAAKIIFNLDLVYARQGGSCRGKMEYLRDNVWETTIKI